MPIVITLIIQSVISRPHGRRTRRTLSYVYVSGLESADNELNRFRNQTHTDCHPVNTQFSQCAVCFDQQFTESTVIPTSAARSHTVHEEVFRFRLPSFVTNDIFDIMVSKRLMDISL